MRISLIVEVCFSKCYADGFIFDLESTFLSPCGIAFSGVQAQHRHHWDASSTRLNPNAHDKPLANFKYLRWCRPTWSLKVAGYPPSFPMRCLVMFWTYVLTSTMYRSSYEHPIKAYPHSVTMYPLPRIPTFRMASTPDSPVI